MRQKWSENELVVALRLYCKLPFGQLHSRNPLIISVSAILGRSPSSLAMKLSNFASLDPMITSTGRKGLSGASRLDRVMWQAMNTDWTAFVHQSEEILTRYGITMDENRTTDADAQEEKIGMDTPVTTTRRLGQTFFRETVLSAYDRKCCITGLQHPRLLVASHIIPWSVDSQNRLNPRNGLCLSSLHDKAFDVGLITIDNNLRVCVSASMNTHDRFFMETIGNYDGKTIHVPDKFHPDLSFLDYHRQNIFAG